MANALPNFEHFPVHSDEATLGTRWKRWLTRFEILLTALSVTEKARKKALLLHYAGDEVFTIYESFTAQQRGENSADEYKALVDSFNAHFTPKKNIDFETFKFRQCRQNEGETIDGFYTRLRLLSTRCDFENEDREIKAQILQGCTSSRLRKRALRDEKLSLTQLLDTARLLELSDKQAQEMEGELCSATAHMVISQNRRRSTSLSKMKSDKSHQQRGPQQHFNQGYASQYLTVNSSQNSKMCNWCGGQQHPREKCPAKKKICNSCSKVGHYAKVCRSGKPRSYPRRRPANVMNIQCGDGQPSSDEEYGQPSSD